MPTVLFHVTRAANRASIREHGLDWKRISRPGVAGNRTPEAEGVYLARDRWEADWFVQMGQTVEPSGGLIDVWQITFDEDFDPEEPPDHLPLVETDTGFLYCTAPIPPEMLKLLL